MVVEGALRRAIVDDPTDYFPRLALMDHLEEEGKIAPEISGFIREQIARPECCEVYERYGWDKSGWSSRREDNVGVVGSIGEWILEGFPKKCGMTSITVRGGFIEEIRIEVGGFFDYMRPLFSRFPIKKVDLIGMRPLYEAEELSGEGSYSWLSDRYLFDDSTFTWENHYRRQEATLPKVVFYHMAFRVDNIVRLFYESKDLAYMELSKALVRLGRESANLSVSSFPSSSSLPCSFFQS